MVGLGDLTEGRFSSQALAVSADGAVTVGHGRSPSGQEAFRWTESSGMVGLGDLAGGAFQSVAFDVSADGSVVVGHGSSESGHEAFYWTAESGMVGLGDLEGGVFYSEAYGVSADGFVVVGSGWSTLRGIEAAIWTTDNGMQAQSLQDLLISAGLDLTGWHLEYATGISADGLTIVGYGSHNGYVEGWIATLPNPSVVPLPGAVLLGGMGLVSSGLYLRRRIT
jgi:probable HAF family extracellular repeat protein